MGAINMQMRGHSQHMACFYSHISVLAFIAFLEKISEQNSRESPQSFQFPERVKAITRSFPYSYLLPDQICLYVSVRFSDLSNGLVYIRMFSRTKTSCANVFVFFADAEVICS